MKGTGLLRRFTRGWFDPLPFSIFPIVGVAAFADQMGEWHWEGWQQAAGIAGSWICAAVLEVVIQLTRRAWKRRQA